MHTNERVLLQGWRFWLPDLRWWSVHVPGLHLPVRLWLLLKESAAHQRTAQRVGLYSSARFVAIVVFLVSSLLIHFSTNSSLVDAFVCKTTTQFIINTNAKNKKTSACSTAAAQSKNCVQQAQTEFSVSRVGLGTEKAQGLERTVQVLHWHDFVK